MRRSRSRSSSLVEVQVDSRRSVALIEDVSVAETDISSSLQRISTTSTILNGLGQLGGQKVETNSWSLLQAYKKLTGLYGFKKFLNSEGKDLSARLKAAIRIGTYNLVLIQAVFDIRKAVLFGYGITNSTNIGDYVSIVRMLTSIFLGLTFLINTITKNGDIQRFLEETDASSYSMTAYKKRNFYIVTTILLVSISTTSYQNFHRVPNNTSNGTKLEWSFFYRYNENIRAFTANDWSTYKDEVLFPLHQATSKEVFLGIILTGARVVSSLTESLGKDFVLIIALTLSEFTTDLLECNIGSPAFIYQFEELKHLSKLANKAMSGFYEVYLLDNLLMLSDFYNHCLNPIMPRSEKIGLGIGVAKVLLLSFIGERISRKMEHIADWIQDFGIRPRAQQRHQLHDAELKLILEDINRYAVGIGRGGFFINKTFLVNYFGISFAYFLSVVETRTYSSHT